MSKFKHLFSVTSLHLILPLWELLNMTTCCCSLQILFLVKIAWLQLCDQEELLSSAIHCFFDSWKPLVTFIAFFQACLSVIVDMTVVCLDLSQVAVRCGQIIFLFYSISAHFPAVASSISLLQTSLFLAVAFQFRISRTRTTFLQTSSFHLPLGFSTCFPLPKSTHINFWG